MNTRRNGKNGLNASPVIPHVIPGIYLFEGLGQNPQIPPKPLAARPARGPRFHLCVRQEAAMPSPWGASEAARIRRALRNRLR